MLNSVADLIVRHLRQAGVAFLFGVPGGGSNLDLVDAAGRAGLPFVLTATETAAALAAVAQAEIGGKPGACLTTLGPGVTSVVNGVACAWLERAPLLVFTDSQPAAAARFEHQRIDHRALLAPVVKWSAILSPEDADAVMREAIARTMAEPRGPVHIDCPGDVLSAAEVTKMSSAAIARPSAAAPSTAETLAALDTAAPALLLARAKRPLLLVGLGARHAVDADAIAALCARRGVPALVTYKAKGVVPDSARHFGGVFTNGSLERSLIAEADLLMAVGLDPVELLPRPWTFAQPAVHIGATFADTGHIPYAAQLVADIPSGLRTVGDLLGPSAWDMEAVRQAVDAQRQRVCPTSDRLTAHRVVQIVAHAVPVRTRVTVDAGAHMFPATVLWPVAEPNGMLISNGLSTMGCALPAAIGAALTERGSRSDDSRVDDRPVVALTGDGGLLMCCGELLTAVREQLHVVVIVFADASLSLIDIKQRQRRLAPSGVALGAIDWCALAASVGAAATRAGTEDDLERAVQAAVARRGPTLIEAQIDPGTYGETLRTIRG